MWTARVEFEADLSCKLKEFTKLETSWLEIYTDFMKKNVDSSWLDGISYQKLLPNFTYSLCPSYY